MNNQIILTELAKTNVTAMNKNNLIDVSRLALDTSIPKEKRTAHIMHTLKNPYCFRYGDIGIKLEFADHTRSLQEAFEDLLKRKKGGI